MSKSNIMGASNAQIWAEFRARQEDVESVTLAAAPVLTLARNQPHVDALHAWESDLIASTEPFAHPSRIRS